MNQNEVMEVLNCTEEQAKSFVLYAQELLRVNEHTNLTTITDEGEVLVKHFLDSIILCKYFDIPKNAKIIDVGTGAGFPGVPLAILNPEASFTLLDSRIKKTKFLKDIKGKLKINNINIYHERIENFAREDAHRGKYDIVVSRAVAGLPTLLEYTIPFLKVNGLFIGYKSQKLHEEIEASQSAFEKLKCRIIEIRDYCIQDAIRKLVIIQKDEKTPKKYPRRLGIPKKKPL